MNAALVSACLVSAAMVPAGLVATIMVSAFLVLARGAFLPFGPIGMLCAGRTV
ncbi:MAG TPA: hypothetical protein VN419_11150 [Humidesulfovibrio sp.]|uniref:hypothetical protein n=1 Tax=Humidesulfovibrio sp. TaxID=2910988 RepID=UPI002C1ED4E1|nr:hypothetical protein [Humidesulfovibrio sp.]HWR04564.1 hypothetical protein [Humidesulfovibrio sp.]